jgi:magnesium transporter
MIVDCAVYAQGKRVGGKREVTEAGRASRLGGTFVWLGLHEPTEDEFESVRREFDLHELAVEDAIKAHQRPKLEVYDDTLFIVLKPVHYIDPNEQIETGEILLFVNPGFVISVRHGTASALGDVRRELERRADLVSHGTGAVLYAIVDRVVDDYSPAADAIEQDIDEVEQQVFTTARANPAERIYKLEREVLEFHRAVIPLREPFARLADGTIRLIDPELQTYFRDVHDHLLRTAQRIENYRELLSTMLQANLTQVSVRQNEDMRKITAWVAIAAVPTMIAGIYGMNFEHMPELRWTFGYPLVMGLVLVICVGLYVRFRRAGWL